MTKKLLASLLVFVLLFAMLPTALAAPTYDPDCKIVLKGTTSNFGESNVSGLKMEFQMRVADAKGNVKNIQKIMLVYDTSKLKLISNSNGGELTIPENFTTFVSGTDEEDTPFTNALSSNMSADVNAVKVDDSHVLLMLQVKHSAASGTNRYAKTDPVTMFTFAFKYAGADTAVNNTWMNICTPEMALTYNQNDVCKITTVDGTVYAYGNIDRSTSAEGSTATVNTEKDKLECPKIIVNGNELTPPAPTLTGITLTASGTTATVPTGATAATIAEPTVTAVPSGADASGATFGLYTAADGNTAFTKTGVTVNTTTGEVTVAKTASTSLSDGANTCYLIAKKGSVTSNAIQLTITKAAAELTTFSAAIGNPSSVKLPRTGTASTGTVTFTAKDQYGNNFTVTPTATTLPTGVTYSGGKLVVDTTASVAANQTVTFTAGAKTADVKLTVTQGDGPAAPNAAGVNPSAAGNDGKITGVDNTMEYKKQGETSYRAITGTEVTGLSDGTYLVRVKATADGKYAAGADKTVTLTAPGKSATPIVTVSASTTTPAEGAEVTLTATVTSDQTALVYQWTKDGVDIPSATNATYVISSMAQANNGTYNVKVKNTEAGKAQSNEGTAATAVTLTMKTKTALTVSKKLTASQNEGALDIQGLVTVTDGKWDVVKNAVKAKVYKFVEAVADDPETDADETAAADYEEVTGSLTAGTYYVDVAVEAITNDDYTVGTFAFTGAPSASTAPDDLTGYVKLTVNASAPSGGGYAPSSYTVRFVAGDHGTLNGEASVTVKRGESLTSVPTVTAKDGFVFKGWSQDGKTVVDPLTVKITGSMTFTALYEEGGDPYIKGDGAGHFRPGATASRAELATMLARLSKDFDVEGKYDVANSDMVAGAWYEPYMKYVVKTGIMSGYGDGTYKPNAAITRGEFAKMLACYLGLELNSSESFADATGWAAPYINALKQAGVVRGYEDGSFRQNNLLTRAEAVTMINKAVDLAYKAGANYEKSFTDVSNSHWAYGDIIAAANTPVGQLVK